MRISSIGDGGRGGFTLLEVLVVLTIMGLLSAALLPNYTRTMSRLRLNQATHDLLSDLGRARQLAFTSKKPVDVLFFPEGPHYVINDRAYRLKVKLQVTQEHQSTPRHDAVSTLRFFADGSATPLTISLSEAGNKAAIHINWLTGRARVIHG